MSSTSKIKTNTMLLLILLMAVLSSAAYGAENQQKFMPFIWPSQPPKDIPFEQSKDLVGILFTGTGDL